MVLEDVENESGGNNDGGLKQNYYFGLASDVLTWPGETAAPATYAENVEQTSEVVMKTGKRMWYIQMTIERPNGLKSESAGSVGSLSAINTLRGQKAKINSSSVGWLEEHKNDDLFLIVEGINGQQRFIGSKDLPAKFRKFIVDGAETVDGDVMLDFEIASLGRIAKFYGTVAAPLAIPLTPAA